MSVKSTNENDIAPSQEIFRRYGFAMEPSTLAQLCKYHDFLQNENLKMNLTAVEETEEIYEKHFVDSLMLGKTIDLDSKSLLDVGSGAGFPGVPLKIVHPDIELTIVDSTRKRIRFLENLRGLLGLSFTLHHGRIEEFDRSNTYDIVVARAVARLNTLLELCLPFVKVGGMFVAYKGREYQEEIEASVGAMETLGGRLGRVDVFDVAGATRALIHVEKIKQTPAKYPREFKHIKKNPL